MRNLLQKFQHLLTQLSTHPDIVLRDGMAEIHPMHHLQRKYGLLGLPTKGIELTPDTEDLFELTHHLGLWWQGLQDGNVVVAGEWKLLDIDLFYCYGNIKEGFFRYSVHRDDPKMKQMLMIDDRPRSGGMEFGMGWQDPDRPGLPEEMYYYDRGELWRMSLDYTGYVEEMIRFMSVNRWQIIFCEEVEFADSRWNHYFPKLKADLLQMNRMFPAPHWQEAIDKLAPLAEASAARLSQQKRQYDLSDPSNTVEDLMVQTLLDRDFCEKVLVCQSQGGVFQNDADFTARMSARYAEEGMPDFPGDPAYLRFRRQLHTFLDHVRLSTVYYTLAPKPRKLP